MKNIISKINEQTRISYNLVANTYHELFKNEINEKTYDRELLDKFSEYFDSTSIIYDVGCGPSGHIARYLYEKGLNLIGVDISEKCVELALKFNPMMEFKKMDMMNLNLNDETIDGIISFYSIIHTPKNQVNLLFKEFHRVLRKHGKILVTVKEGIDEGFQNELLGFPTEIYFSYFLKGEIEYYLNLNHFKVIYLDRRLPIEGEISVPRIYAIGDKY